MEQYNILIVEDDFASRKFMMNFMSAYGDCDGTVDGMEAVEAYMMALEDEQPYDLICLDVMMPVMDGITAAKHIRKLKREDAGSVLILAITAQVSEENARKCLDAGMDGYIPKPIDARKLGMMLRKTS